MPSASHEAGPGTVRSNTSSSPPGSMLTTRSQKSSLSAVARRLLSSRMSAYDWTRRTVVDVVAPASLRPQGDGAVGRTQMAQQHGDLPVRELKDGFGDELLV